MDADTVVSQVQDLVHYLAWNYDDQNTPLMDHDELAGELFLEVAKAIKRYSHLPYNQLLALIKTMMNNRLSELKYKYYMTHRGAISNGRQFRLVDELEDDEPGTVPVGGDNPEIIVEGRLFVEAFLGELSDTARLVASTVIYGNELLSLHVSMAGIRASYVYQNNGKTIEIQPWHVARALDLDVSVVEAAFDEIRTALRGYDELQ